MEELYKLKEMLCDELESYGKKKELTAGSLDVIDKLSHALKSITTVIAMEEADGEYSNDYPMNGRSYRGSSYRGSSYARGRTNARRDSLGRYSREYSGAVDDMVGQLNDLMEDAPNESIKAEMRRLVKKIETM